MISTIFLLAISFLMIVSAIFLTLETTILLSFLMLFAMYIMILEHNKYKKIKCVSNSPKKVETKCVHTINDCEICVSQSICLSQAENLVKKTGGE